MTDEWFSVDQVAQRLGLHVRTVRNYVRDGRLKAVRIGKQYRIARSDLEELTGRSAAGCSGGGHPAQQAGGGLVRRADRRDLRQRMRIG